MPESDTIGIALKMHGVSKRYQGTLAVDRVDFEAYAGEVHVLMGENGAGKSTLMKILAGSFNDYIGSIVIGQKEVLLHSPAKARECGVGMIYQELSVARPISIAENLLVGRLPYRYGFWLDKKAMYRQAQQLLRKVGLDIDPWKTIGEISQHEAQLVEIARILGVNPCILVMDEPTSALSRREVQCLFARMRQLKNRGITILYISHHLPEVFEIADRITIMRDGRIVATKSIHEVTPPMLVQMMVGKTLEKPVVSPTRKIGEPVLKVKHLTRNGFFSNVSFHACKGEILGIAGLTGAGRTDIARSLCGLAPYDRGTVELEGQRLRRQSYSDAIKHGLMYLSEDRKIDGLFLRLSIKQNLISATLQRNTHCGLYTANHEAQITSDLIEKLGIVASSVSQEVSNLSGGNQQKVLLGKWIAADPRVLILDEPTRGVDVKARVTIHRVVRDLVEEGRTVLLISSDLPELVGLSDRVIVLHNGRLAGEMNKTQLSEESVLLAMNGEVV